MTNIMTMLDMAKPASCSNTRPRYQESVYRTIGPLVCDPKAFKLLTITNHNILGFLEKEIKKDGIPMLDTGDNPDAPVPREMIDLEVGVQEKDKRSMRVLNFGHTNCLL